MKKNNKLLKILALLLLICSTIFFYGCSASSGCNNDPVGDLAVPAPTFTPEPTPAPTVTPEPTPTLNQRYLLSLGVFFRDGKPISGVRVTSDNPALDLSNFLTDAAGNIITEVNIPVGTQITLTFTKDRYIIQSLTFIFGIGGTTTQNGNTITYHQNLITYGYIPFVSEGITTESKYLTKPVALFYNPQDIIKSSDGKFLLISDSNIGTVRKIDLGTGEVSTIFSLPERGAIHCLALKSDDSILYMSLNDGIYSIPMAKNLKQAPTLIKKFVDPGDLQLSKDDKLLYIIFYNTSKIVKLDLDTLTEDSSFAANVASSATSPNYRSFISIKLTADNSKLYAIDTATGNTARFDALTGVRDTTFNPAPVPFPKAIELSLDEKTLYAGTDYDFFAAGTKIVEIDTGTAVQKDLVNLVNYKPNQQDATFMGKQSAVSSMVISSTGTDLYVTDTFDATVMKVPIKTPTQTSIYAGWTTGQVDGPIGIPPFNYMEQMVFNPDETFIYVADAGNHRIEKVDTKTGEQTSFIGSGSLEYPVGLALTKDGKYLYVSDANQDLVTRIDTATQAVDTTFSISGFSMPTGLAISPDDTKLYVCDSQNNAIKRIDITTKSLDMTIPITSTRPGPYSIVVTKDGSTLYASDANNKAIIKINAATGVIDPNFKVEGLNLPAGIALSADDSKIFVIDIMSHGLTAVIKQVSITGQATDIGTTDWMERSEINPWRSPKIGLGILIDKNSLNMYIGNQFLEQVIQLNTVQN